MNKTLTTIFLCALNCSVFAQKDQPKELPVQSYGKIEQADLELKACDFEKDANAEVLFEKGTVYFGTDISTITEEIHKRIKIFNEHGKGEANVKIKFYSGDHLEYITGLQAETINLVNGKVEITKLDKKLVYTKVIDKAESEITFSMPDVKPGSVIEFKYNWNTTSFYNMPDWYFQEKIPTRYSELNTSIPDVFYFREIPHMVNPLVKRTNTSDGRSLIEDGQTYPYTLDVSTKAMANIPSLPDEPFMSSFNDNVQNIRYQLVSIKPIGGFSKSYSDTWNKVGGRLIDDEDFGGQLRRKLNGEEAIISKAKTLKTDDQKIAYIFNAVKTAMKWNGEDKWYTIDGTYRAWENKTGNSAEVNLILYHLLKSSGVDAYPMVVSTREHGKVDPYYTSLVQFNRAVVYVPIDSASNYVLDATGKYNIYNETPAELLNSVGLYIDKPKNHYDMIRLTKTAPVRQVVMISAEIKPTGKVEGTAQIISTSYNRISAVERYKKDGEKKYIDFIRDDDNNLKVSDLKFENMEVDSLPLTQKLNFNLDLAGSDENYIYLNPNIFTSLKTNPFLNETRMTDIDFGYLRNYAINSIYKLPVGYKTDALPKSVSLVTPDKMFTFKRMVIEQDGSIIIHYSLNYNVAEYSKRFLPGFS